MESVLVAAKARVKGISMTELSNLVFQKKQSDAVRKLTQLSPLLDMVMVVEITAEEGKAKP